MKRVLHGSRGIWLVLLILVISGAFVINRSTRKVAGAVIQKPNLKSNDWTPFKIENSTKLRILSCETNGAFQRISLINTYPMGIGSIYFEQEIDSSNVAALTINPLYSGHSIRPGEKFEEKIDLSSATPNHPYRLAAVAFDDGSFDGDSRGVFVLREDHRAAQKQMKRICKLMDETVECTSHPRDNQKKDCVSYLREAVLALPDAPTSESGPYQSAFKTTKQRFLSDMQAIRATLQIKNERELKASLSNLRQKYDQIVSSLCSDCGESEAKPGRTQSPIQN